MDWHREPLIGFELETTRTDPGEARDVAAAAKGVRGGQPTGHRERPAVWPDWQRADRQWLDRRREERGDDAGFCQRRHERLLFDPSARAEHAYRRHR